MIPRFLFLFLLVQDSHREVQAGKSLRKKSLTEQTCIRKFRKLTYESPFNDPFRPFGHCFVFTFFLYEKN
jgi:hypothetical protein